MLMPQQPHYTCYILRSLSTNPILVLQYSATGPPPKTKNIFTSSANLLHWGLCTANIARSVAGSIKSDCDTEKWS